MSTSLQGHSCVSCSGYHTHVLLYHPILSSGKKSQSDINKTQNHGPTVTTSSPISSETDLLRSPPSQHDSPTCPVAAQARHRRPLTASVVAVAVAAVATAVAVVVAVVRRDEHLDQIRWCWG